MLPCLWAAGTDQVWICQGLLWDQVFPSAPCLLEGLSVRKLQSLQRHLEDTSYKSDDIIPEWWHHSTEMVNNSITISVCVDGTCVCDVCSPREAFKTWISHPTLETDRLITDLIYTGAHLSLVGSNWKHGGRTAQVLQLSHSMIHLFFLVPGSTFMWLVSTVLVVFLLTDLWAFSSNQTRETLTSSNPLKTHTHAHCQHFSVFIFIWIFTTVVDSPWLLSLQDVQGYLYVPETHKHITQSSSLELKWSESLCLYRRWTISPEYNDI